ncbi:ImmA/IrrE family metallo-endopeptidase [Micromonospora sp. NPDC003816]|uniref:ImmA/IrrE family metallo-endopeptidase n=1 Tax=Micromonospora sp. NPDC003816 TaxID=3364224 RepID=UPI00367FFC6F
MANHLWPTAVAEFRGSIQLIGEKFTAPDVAARRLAALFVDRINLRPPVDVRGLLELHAEVTDLDWPFPAVDALVVGLGERRPKVFLRSQAPRRRLRFTMAHELAHVLIPWHAGSASCHPDYNTYEHVMYGREQQADIFASCLMAPDRWIGHLIATHGQDMDALLGEAQQADLSALATVMALRRNLFAGWAFVVHGSIEESIVGTTGTSIPYRSDTGTFDRATLEAVAHARGAVSLNGRTVSWYRLYEVADMPALAADTRTNTELLREALGQITDDPKRARSLEQSVNGKIGGILREAVGRSPHELFHALVYRFANDGYEDLLALQDFRSWLARKARDVASGNTKRRRL